MSKKGVFNTEGKVGQVFTLNSGLKVKLIEYLSSSNCTIQFEDGMVKNNVSYYTLKIGAVRKPIDRVGEYHISNNCGGATIIDYIDSNNCTIKFDNGFIKANVTYSNLVNGNVCHSLGLVGEKFFTDKDERLTVVKMLNTDRVTVIDEDTGKLRDVSIVSLKKDTVRYDYQKRIGEKFTNGQGDILTIISYKSSSDCTIRFEDGTVLSGIRYRTLNTICNPNFPSNFGIGFIGIGRYNSKEHGFIFNVWRSMIQRCYSVKHQQRYPTYKGCSVAEEWHNFQNFAKWYEKNYNPETMKGWQLDKDITMENNKVYSPETCSLVPKEINIFFVKSELGILGKRGVSEVKGLFVARITKNSKKIHIGSYSSIELASQAYEKERKNYAKELAEKYKDTVSEEVYNALNSFNIKRLVKNESDLL